MKTTLPHNILLARHIARQKRRQQLDALITAAIAGAMLVTVTAFAIGYLKGGAL